MYNSASLSTLSWRGSPWKTRDGHFWSRGRGHACQPTVMGAGERVGSDTNQLVRSAPAEERQKRQNHNEVEKHIISHYPFFFSIFFFFLTGRLTLWQWFCSKYSEKPGHSVLVQLLGKTPSEGLDTVDNTHGTSAWGMVDSSSHTAEKLPGWSLGPCKRLKKTE